MTSFVCNGCGGKFDRLYEQPTGEFLCDSCNPKSGRPMCGKKRYETQGACLRELAAAKEAFDAGDMTRLEYRHYHCGDCGAWHTTKCSQVAV